VGQAQARVPLQIRTPGFLPPEVRPDPEVVVDRLADGTAAPAGYHPVLLTCWYREFSPISSVRRRR
jgi:hypothetical protein